MNNRYIYLLILVVAATRLLPHPANFTPIGALALFSGATIEDKRGYLVPLLALAIGDVIAGLYAPVVMACVYLGFALSTAIGAIFLRRRRTPARYALAISISALVFYFISNGGVWYAFYSHDAIGIVQCYINGLPFLLRSLLADTLYTALVFGALEMTIRLQAISASPDS